MDKTIFLNAGHSERDPGALIPNNRFEYESQLNMVIRDFVVPELQEQGFKVIAIPDNKNLLESILAVNEETSDIDDGLALAIHCNKSPEGYEGSKEGAEAYHYADFRSSERIAEKLIDAYCKETGIKNRGAIPDSTTRFGKLGWIRETTVWATLLECGYLDNNNDMDFILNNLDKVAKGIAKGVCAIYGIPYKEKVSESELPPPETIEEMNKKSLALKEIIEILKKYKII